MSISRSEITSAVLNDKIYVIGGFENGRSPTPEVEVYDPITNNWTIVAPLPQPLDHTAAASYNGKLYVVGGGYLDRNTLSNKLFVYDPNANQWTQGANLPDCPWGVDCQFHQWDLVCGWRSGLRENAGKHFGL